MRWCRRRSSMLLCIGWHRALLVAGGLILTNVIVDNVVTPIFMKHAVDVSFLKSRYRLWAGLLFSACRARSLAVPLTLGLKKFIANNSNEAQWPGRFRASWAPAEVLRLLKAAARFEMRNFRLKDEAQAALPDSDGAGTVSGKGGAPGACPRATRRIVLRCLKSFPHRVQDSASLFSQDTAGLRGRKPTSTPDSRHWGCFCSTHRDSSFSGAQRLRARMSVDKRRARRMVAAFRYAKCQRGRSGCLPSPACRSRRLSSIG